RALDNNTTGRYNTGIGSAALSGGLGGDTGSYNTAAGVFALAGTTSGNNNVANGVEALQSNSSGNDNVANGFEALQHANDTGNTGVAGDSYDIRIGDVQTNTFVAGIFGQVIPGGTAVIIDSTGHLGTILSSERVKDAIRPMDRASEAILSLRPVTFRYKHE